MTEPMAPERLAEIKDCDRTGYNALLVRRRPNSAIGHRRELLAEVARLQSIVADYESRITWHTTCQQCATTLDRAIADFERAERAEAEAEWLTRERRPEWALTVGNVIIASGTEEFVRGFDHTRPDAVIVRRLVGEWRPADGAQDAATARHDTPGCAPAGGRCACQKGGS
jgi:hypothetical protein